MVIFGGMHGISGGLAAAGMLWLACLEAPARPEPMSDASDGAASQEVADPKGCRAQGQEVAEGAAHPAEPCRVCGPSGDFVACPFTCRDGSCTRPVEAALGDRHSCARLDDGTVACWGDGALGQRGDDGSDAATPTPHPRVVEGLPPAVMLAAGRHHVCALSAVGGVHCWGDNGSGQVALGPEAPTVVVTPMPVEVPAARSLALGQATSCVIDLAGRVHCWGLALDGQDEAPDGESRRYEGVTAIGGLAGVEALALGSRSGCARLDDDQVRCWGDGALGQLGDGGLADATTPVEVAFAAPVAPVMLASGGTFRLLVADAGARLLGWGDNRRLQLGTLVHEAHAPRPFDVSAYAPAPIAVARGGWSHACALGGDRKVRCWGTQVDGNLGHGEAGGHPARTVPALDDPIGLWLGRDHGCALERAGWLRCWGKNAHAQSGAPLSYGASVTRPVIVSVAR